MKVLNVALELAMCIVPLVLAIAIVTQAGQIDL